MKNRNNLPKELRNLVPQIVNKRDEFRQIMLGKSLQALGYTFTNLKEADQFLAARVKVEADPKCEGVFRIYLDFGKPEQIMLAEYNNFPEITDDGNFIFKDVYHTDDDASDKPHIKALQL